MTSELITITIYVKVSQ